MTMTIYKSTDASAPTLQGIVGGAYSSGWADGSLLQLLKKCLVDGYGSKSAAGWTLSFTGTSEGVFRQGGGCQFYLHVLDDGSATAGAKEANFNGGESYTAVSTGTALFPTASQNAGKVYFRKSETADATHRDWIVFADNKTVYVFAFTGNATPYYSGMMFGDFYSYKSGDTYNCMAIGRNTSASSDTLGNENIDQVVALGGSPLGHYVARGYTGIGTSVLSHKVGIMFSSSTTGAPGAGTTELPFPNPADGKVWLSRYYIIDPTSNPTNSVRGYLRGYWATQHVATTMPGEYDWAGVGSLAGRTFRALGLRTGGNGKHVLEISDTWD